MGHKKRCNTACNVSDDNPRKIELATFQSEGSDYSTIKLECECAFTMLRCRNHTKQMKQLKEICAREEGSPHAAFVNQVQNLMCFKTAMVITDLSSKQRHLRNALNYQMNPTNYREALTEMREDESEGVDILLVLIGDVITANSSHREFFHAWKRYGVLSESHLAANAFLSCTILLNGRKAKLSFGTAYLMKYVIAGDLQDRTPLGTVQVLTPSNQANTPQFSKPLKSDTMNKDAIIRSDDAEFGEADQEEQKYVDPLDKFLPPPSKARCSEELQVSSVKMNHKNHKIHIQFNMVPRAIDSSLCSCFTNAGIGVAEGLNLEALVVAGDGSIDLVEHGEDVVELHVAREGGEGMIGAAFDVGNFDSAFEDGDDFFKASKAAVDGSEDVEAHGEVEAGLSLNDATLKGPGGPNSEVEDLGGPIARGNGVAGQLKEEWAEIWVVERGIREKRRGF
ncbi:hypothetical protein D0Y65_001223 [Glycine soja]|uniref:DUF627 domain-containing protein n=1 Tax=Glycine soja TaxID=3848 RepID=A0A445M230_GLYSO|nr:hypothetical protein D0Y65_001223 [Glycine soja]